MPAIWNHILTPVFGQFHVFTEENHRFHLSRKTYCLPRTTFPSCKVWKLCFSCWAQHFDFIKTCQYPTVNSQVLIFYDRALELCNLYDEMPLFLTIDVPIYRFFRTNQRLDYWPFGPMERISDQWPLGLPSCRTIVHSNQCTIFGSMNLRTNDHSEYRAVPLPMRAVPRSPHTRVIIWDIPAQQWV